MSTQTLELPQTPELNDAFVGAFNSQSEFGMVLASIGKNFNTIAAPGSNLDRYFQVITVALEEGWLDDLALIAHERKPTHPGLCAFIRQHFGDKHLQPECRAALIVPADPFEVRFLRSNRSVPFVNRVELREKLRSMFDIRNGPRVLAIHGESPKSGKTYSKELIRFLALNKDQHTAYVDINEEWVPDFGPLHLVRLLGKKIKADINRIPQREAQVARWNKELCKWLYDEIVASDLFWWIIIDGFNNIPRLSDDVEEFIYELVELIEDDAEQPQMHFRLVLIGYNAKEAQLNLLRNRAEQDVINSPIGLMELTCFFENQVDQFKAEHDLSDEDVAGIADDLANWVLEKLGELAEADRVDSLEGFIGEAMAQLRSLKDEEGNG